MKEEASNTKGRFTIRTNEDTEIIIRHSYELNRQSRLLDGHRALSLNDFLIKMISEGLELEELDRRKRERLYEAIAMQPKEERM